MHECINNTTIERIGDQRSSSIAILRRVIIMSNVADSAPSSADVSSLNRQHNDDHQTTVKQTKLAERHQLIRAFWSKFVHCNDDKEKVSHSSIYYYNQLQCSIAISVELEFIHRIFNTFTVLQFLCEKTIITLWYYLQTELHIVTYLATMSLLGEMVEPIHRRVQSSYQLCQCDVPYTVNNGDNNRTKLRRMSVSTAPHICICVIISVSYFESDKSVWTLIRLSGAMNISVLFGQLTLTTDLVIYY